MNWPLILTTGSFTLAVVIFFQYRTLGKLGRTYWEK